MANLFLATFFCLLLKWNAFLPAAGVAPVALASRGDSCPSLHVLLDGREGKEHFLWKCGESLRVLLTIKNAPAPSTGDTSTSSPWSNLLCRNDGRDVTFLPINRTTRYLDLLEPCPGNDKKTFTCSLSVSRRCHNTKYFAIYFVHLPEATVEILDYDSLVASAAVPAFHLQNLFFPHFEWREEGKIERLCSFEDRRWYRTSAFSSFSPTPPGSTVFTAILTHRSLAEDDDGQLDASFPSTSPGCNLRIDNPYSSITYRVKLLSQHPLTRGDELHSPWTTAQLLDLVVPNNASAINVTDVTSRSLSLEWTVDEALIDWRVPVHYQVQASSHCDRIKETTNKNKFKLDGTLFPGQVLMDVMDASMRGRNGTAGVRYN